MACKRDCSYFTTINVALTNRCNKKCWICGRRKVERENPELVLTHGDMELDLVRSISAQLPRNTVVQLHNNGDAFLYPHLGETISLFRDHITNAVANGKLLLEGFGEVVDHLDTLSISVFEDDEEADEQYEVIGEFLAKKKDRKPFTSLRLIGNVDREKYRKFGALLITRTLHSPMGSFQYRRKPTIPEIGICWDFLHHPAIDVKGDFSICVRFDPRRCGVLGNVKTQSIDAIWKGEKRATWLRHHVDGRRDMIPLCSYCEYWGVPTGS